MDNVSNTKHSLSNGLLNKILCHIHWCLAKDLSSGTLTQTFLEIIIKKVAL